MVQTLTVYYLHSPAKSDARALAAVESGLTDAFRSFCREVFDTTKPLDYPILKLVTVATADELNASIFEVEEASRHFLSYDGEGACLFMIDDVLMDSVCEGMSLVSWFRTYFPAIPKVVVTFPGHPDVPVPTRRWTKKPFALFAHPAKHGERIEHLFKSFWMPRFWTALKSYVARRAGTNWHTPGHNGGRAFEHSPFLHGFHDAFGSTIFRDDLSVSVESLGDLSSPEARTPLSEAQKLTSEIFGTAQSCFVTNGTSTSNKAMLQTLLRPGETVLVDRNCHKSVHHAIVMSGAVPHYLPAHWNARLGVWSPVSLDDIDEALATGEGLPESAKPRLLILTTCTYEGVLYPVWEISRRCEKAGVLFYADEAWAPYLNFHPFYTAELDEDRAVRYNAVNEVSGAHFAAHSTHKALSAFSQASMIHVSTRFKALLEEDGSKQFRWLRKRFALKGRGSYEKFSHDLHEILRYWHSTSPHYPFMATLDTAGVQMRLEGLKLIEERLHWVAAFRARVSALLKRPEDEIFAGLKTICQPGGDWREDGYMHDPLKLVVLFKSPNACAKFRRELLKAHIQWEKSSSTSILFLVTVGTREEHFEYLYRVIRLHKALVGLPRAVAASEEVSVSSAVSVQPAVLPRDAALCDGELVPIGECEGRIASQFLVPYPPGIPVFIPGLRITKSMIALVEDVIASSGPQSVHGLFCRGNHAPYLVEVLNRDEESRVQTLV